ncbi:hypothetical protein I4U23_008422 [Adineta vaga]|nr:hypothetical protein I4U23_008422 [Adineta vaga]
MTTYKSRSNYMNFFIYRTCVKKCVVDDVNENTLIASEKEDIKSSLVENGLLNEEEDDDDDDDADDDDDEDVLAITDRHLRKQKPKKEKDEDKSSESDEKDGKKLKKKKCICFQRKPHRFYFKKRPHWPGKHRQRPSTNQDKKRPTSSSASPSNQGKPNQNGCKTVLCNLLSSVKITLSNFTANASPRP